MIQNKTILVTGGTGSLSRAFIELVLCFKPKKVISFSRHEYSIVEMQRTLRDPDKCVRWIIGDIRDRQSLWRALDGVNFCFHTAALKNLETTEYSPIETIKTNVMGTANVVDMCIDRNVKKLLVVSTDKCVEPINLYGASKLCAEKLALAANALSPNGTKISSVRFANFVRSTGNVVNLFESMKAEGETVLPLTDSRCTRFFIRLDDAAQFALDCLEKMKGGEVFCPENMPSVRITELAEAIHPEAKWRETGLRKNEKLHEIIELPNGVRCSSSECWLPLSQVRKLLE